MSLAWLRRVLTTPTVISVETSHQLAAEVRAASQGRPAHLNPKRAAPFGRFPPRQNVQIRAVDLLRKIGELTTPSNVNLARLSASWATRRYFWSVRDPGGRAAGPVDFCLSQDARRLERHQKTLLSDEFGIGFAGVLVERLLGTTRFVDMDFALENPQRYFGVRAVTKRRPDYLFWGPGTPVYVVECKGSQTQRSTVIGQLRRGMEQLPSIQIPGAHSEEIVIATHLQGRRTQVFVMDPPTEGDDLPSEGKKERPGESVPEKVREKLYRVKDPEAFAEKLNIGNDLSLLRWVGQHSSAVQFEQKLDLREREIELPDAELQPLETDVGNFLGIRIPLAPELGLTGGAVFRGLRSEVLDRLRTGDLQMTGLAADAPVEPPKGEKANEAVEDPRLSVGPDGTCLFVDIEV